MSLEALAWVLENSPTQGSDKVVLMGIANHANPETWECWPSVARLAKYANLSERQVQSILLKLEEGGAIKRLVQEGGGAKTREDRRPNLYRLLTPNGVKPASPRDPERGEVQRTNGVKPTSPEPLSNRQLSSVDSLVGWQNTESGNYLERKLASRLNLLAVHGERWVQEWPTVAMLNLAWTQATKIASVEGRRPLDAFIWCLNHERPVTGLAELVAAGSRHVKLTTKQKIVNEPMLYEEEDEPA